MKQETQISVDERRTREYGLALDSVESIDVDV
jgi:hypothetical protein